MRVGQSVFLLAGAIKYYESTLAMIISALGVQWEVYLSKRDTDIIETVIKTLKGFLFMAF